jgi:cell wall-associated NlpC family hydrolase
MLLAFAGTPGSATGNPIIAGKHLVAKLSGELASQEAKSESLANQYDGDVSTLDSLTAAIAKSKLKVAHKQAALQRTGRTLVKSLVRSYVDGAAAAEGIPLLNLNVTQSAARKVYEDVALGNINQIEGRLGREKKSLQHTLNTEAAQHHRAGEEIHQIRNLIFENQRNESETRATLAQVSSTLEHEIITYEISVAILAARKGDAQRVENAVAAASAVGGQAAANEVIAAAAAVKVQHRVSGTAAGTKAGLAAVAAAESQIGVPYVWGGESPGIGFDCSGLTQWSWGKAGFSIPRTAAEQYGALRHVPLDQLRPGDLLFYYNLDGDDEIDHVVMYVGSGPYGTETIIAAAHTGTDIGYEPLFTYGLTGAGRP